jgi:hypothetical protein
LNVSKYILHLHILLQYVEPERTSVEQHSPNVKDVDKDVLQCNYLADNVSPGRMLSTPIAKAVKERKTKNHYILCNFLSCLDDAPFQQWVTKNEAIVVSLSYDALL